MLAFIFLIQMPCTPSFLSTYVEYLGYSLNFDRETDVTVHLLDMDNIRFCLRMLILILDICGALCHVLFLLLLLLICVRMYTVRIHR